MSVKKSVKELGLALSNDAEFYATYQANIAQVFIDEAKNRKLKISHADLHKAANKAAQNFLDLFIGDNK